MNFLLDAGVAIYVALAVALAVWVGIFAYLWRLDAQARDLRRRLDSQPDPAHRVGQPAADQAAGALPTATLRPRRASPEEPPGAQEPRPIHSEPGVNS